MSQGEANRPDSADVVVAALGVNSCYSSFPSQESEVVATLAHFYRSPVRPAVMRQDRKSGSITSEPGPVGSTNYSPYPYPMKPHHPRKSLTELSCSDFPNPECE